MSDYPYLAQYRYDKKEGWPVVDMTLGANGYEVDIEGRVFNGLIAMVLEPDKENPNWHIALLGGRKYFVHNSTLFPL